VTPDAFAAEEMIPGLGFVPQLPQDLPGMTAGRWSSTLYSSGGQVLLVQLRKKQPPRQAEFDEVKAKVVEDMKNEQREQLLDNKDAAIRTAFSHGATLDSVANAHGGLKDSGLQLTNAAFLPALGYGPHVMEKLRKMKVGERSDSLSTPSGVMWAKLEEHKDADPSTLKTQREQISREMLIERTNQWLEDKKKTVKIEILRADLKEPKPGPYKTVTLGGGGGG